jgi:hypothetical protein
MGNAQAAFGVIFMHLVGAKDEQKIVTQPLLHLGLIARQQRVGTLQQRRDAT